MRSTKDVIENHIGRFRGGDLEGILDDYSHEAMLFTPAGLLRGRSEIEALFKNLLAEFGKPGASDMVHTEVFEGEYAYRYGALKRQTVTTSSQRIRFLCGTEK